VLVSELGAGHEMRVALLDEQGGVLVLVAVMLPVLVLFVGFAVDIGNWFVHQRHLQTQADAATLAAAAAYRIPCDDATDAAIEAAVAQYSGDTTASYNQQLGGTAADEVHYRINARNWYEDSGTTDTTVREGTPCETGMIDVKMTETDLPLFLRVAGLFSNVDYINTQARVEFFQREFISGALPLGVPDNNPQVGRVIFVDETTGQTLGSRPLLRNGNQGNLALWDNSTDPFPLTVHSDHIGVRVAFGGGTSTTCGDPLVECYDLSGPNGILHVRGYSTAGSGGQPGAPLARNVYLKAGSCSDPYFVSQATTCAVAVHADVDFGACTATGGLPDVGPKLTARVNGTDYPLVAQSCPAASQTSSWETNGSPVTIPSGAGPIDIGLRWEETKGTVAGNTCNTQGGNKCKGTFGSSVAGGGNPFVQRTFSGSTERTGPVRFAQLWLGDQAWANSLERCSPVQTSCTYDVVAKFAIDRNLQENAESVDDPPVSLRFAAGAGSQNQALDCDPAVANLRDEIAHGCEPSYQQNAGTLCPASVQTLWASAQPWNCVAVSTGDATGQIFQGMNLRIHGATNPGSCVSSNRWSDFPNLDPADPRIVPVFITPFGSFLSSGSGTVPVTGAAVFYVTGWDGSQSTCPDDDIAPSKSVVGHFIKYVQALNDGSGGAEPCDASALDPCVAVMTR
jgi:Flp pilus assembly protein TadG